MPTPCRLVDPFPGWDNLQPGDMWFYGRDLWEQGREALEVRWQNLSPEYWATNFAHRPPLFVMLPNGDPWQVDSIASRSGDGWTVTGDPPAITVHPSIHLIGYWHGWLQNGVLSDDPQMARHD